MDNVTKRSLRAEMGEAFEGWADSFFANKESDEMGNEVDEFKYLDKYFSKEEAFEEFMKATKLGKWTTNKFKKAMKAYCQLNGYILNPKDLNGANGRITKNIKGKTQEVFYIRTVENTVPTVIGDVTEYKSEDEIFNN